MNANKPQIPTNRNSQFAVQVVHRLREAGYEALWAGGCVRDLVMGNSPDDYDVATAATPTQVRELFGHRQTLAVGAAFGVIVVLDRQGGGAPVEVATFRTDATYSDGRRPDSVTFSTAKEDAQRRDFTINGMFYDPIDGRIIDFVNGQADLKQGIVRAIGLADARISEDKLRMLRAVRFAARFGFQLNVETFDAIQRHAAGITLVSGERIAVEVQKTLQTRAAVWAVDTWARTGLLQYIIPELIWNDVRDKVHLLLEGVNAAGDDWRARLAALLYAGIQASQWDKVMDHLRARLKWSTNDFQAIQFALQSQSILQSASAMTWSAVQPWLIAPNIQIAMELLIARSRVEPDLESPVRWLNERLSWPRERLDPPPLLTGGTLIDLGYRPSPTFRTALATIRDMQLDGTLRDTDHAIAWLKIEYPPLHE